MGQELIQRRSGCSKSSYCGCTTLASTCSRADIPLYTVKGSDSAGSYSHYALPLSLMAAYSFP